MTGLHRRGLLGRTVAAVATVKPALAMATVSANPDAPLIVWCKAFCAHEDRINAAFAAVADDEWDKAEAVMDRIKVEQRPLLDLICATLPATMEGMRAVAQALMQSLGELDPLRGDEPRATDERRLQVVLLRGGAS